MKLRYAFASILSAMLFVGSGSGPYGDSLERVKYNNPGLVVDLGVGLWVSPLPMDYDGDGDYDLVLSCTDVPYNGLYFFENPGGDVKTPVFRPGVKIGPGLKNARPSRVGDEVRILVPGREIFDLTGAGGDAARVVYPDTKIDPAFKRTRANQWQYCDYDGDGDLDIFVGLGVWDDYGWDNAFDDSGKWTRGPLHGYVYLLLNTGNDRTPVYAAPVRVEAGGAPVDVYGMPSPNFADFDGDGDLDLVCGDFVDRLTYFENVGTRTEPRYRSGRFLTVDGGELRMDLCMIVPAAVDWDRDGDIDLIVGQEDGRVAFVENTGGMVDGMPAFRAPVFFKQIAEDVKFGALVTPVSVDWDGDGDEDLICGNTAGYIGFIENLDGGDPPSWAAPVYLEADGEVIRIMAGYNGSIQGPCEEKWGYTVPAVADWDHDGLPDIVVNSILGSVVWYRNTGTRTAPSLTYAGPVEVEWRSPPPKPSWNWWNPDGKALVTQWRTTPVVTDLNGDGLNDLVMLDHEGYLAFFERARCNGRLVLLPGKRIFRTEGPSSFDSRHRPGAETNGLLRLNAGTAGASGRRKLCLADWDMDGRPDLLVNSVNVTVMKCVYAGRDSIVFRNGAPVDTHRLAGHTTSPTVVDWDGNGIPDLLVGAEDGHLYYMKNPHAAR